MFEPENNIATAYTPYNEEDMFYQPVTRDDMFYITEYNQIENYVPGIKLADCLYVDTETTGLDPHLHKIRLLQIACKIQGKVHYFLIDLWKFDKSKELASELLDRDQIKCFQNAKFDLKMCKGNGIRYSGPLFDTMLAAQIISSGLKDQGFSLKQLAKDWLRIDMKKELGKSDWSVPELSDGQKLYAMGDTEILIPLRAILRKKIIDEKLAKVAQIEFDCVYGTVEMEYHGMKVDEKKLDILIEKYTTKRDEAAEFLRDVLGEDVNINAPGQLKDALNATYTVATGEFFEGTSNEALFEYRDRFPAVRAISQYRKSNKGIDYCIPLKENRHPKTGRIHSTYWPLKTKSEDKGNIDRGTVTGRFSCSQPNVQQIPRKFEFRDCFVAEQGNKLCVSDLSQIELRTLAEVSNDRVMIQAYKEGKDLHRFTGSIITGKPFEEVTPEERQASKAINFGLSFSMSAPTLKNYAAYNYGVNISLEQAEQYRNNFFKQYSGVKEWHDRQFKICRKNRRTFDLAGRRRLWAYVPPLAELVNTPIQSTAGSCLKIVLGKLGKMFKDSTDIKLIGAIHDELIIECPENKSEEISRVLHSNMISGVKQLIKKVPIEANTCIGDTWGECK